jgi:outer membrane biosynthesis protein TonB
MPKSTIIIEAVQLVPAHPDGDLLSRLQAALATPPNKPQPKSTETPKPNSKSKSKSKPKSNPKTKKNPKKTPKGKSKEQTRKKSRKHT